MVNEGFEQRLRQGGDGDGGQEPTTGHLPERRLRNMIPPKDLPSHDGSSIGLGPIVETGPFSIVKARPTVENFLLVPFRRAFLKLSCSSSPSSGPRDARLKDLKCPSLDESARGRLSLFLGLTPWEQDLPWAPFSLLRKHVPRPAGASLVLAFAIGEGAAGGISRGVGINAIAKTRTAAGFFVGGKLVADRPSDARLPK